jgi:hypothetical protein
MPLPASLIVALLVGCTPTGEDETPDTTSAVAAAVPEVTAPPERGTPFCQAMLDLDAALPDDPAIDTRDQVLTAYQDALPLVPPEIDIEFRAVIEALESGTRATVPGDEPASDEPVEGTISPPATAEPEPADDPASTPAPEDTAPLPDDQLFAEEGWLPDDDPAVRVNEYVDFACRDTINNPGPAATAPDAAPPTSDTG